MLTVD
jgi:uncharacterized protein YaaR (DUF327 family)